MHRGRGQEVSGSRALVPTEPEGGLIKWLPDGRNWCLGFTNRFGVKGRRGLSDRLKTRGWKILGSGEEGKKQADVAVKTIRRPLSVATRPLAPVRINNWAFQGRSWGEPISVRELVLIRSQRLEPVVINRG